MKVLHFITCRVEIFPDARHVSTIYPDGSRAEACPNYREEDFARAQSLGYGQDVWTMTVEHELAHTILSEMKGLPHSPALWAAAHPKEERLAPEIYEAEEAEVFAMQRFHRLMKKNLFEAELF